MEAKWRLMEALMEADMKATGGYYGVEWCLSMNLFCITSKIGLK
jgi:hypothetical protein